MPFVKIVTIQFIGAKAQNGVIMSEYIDSVNDNEDQGETASFVNIFTFPDFPSDKESLAAAFSKAQKRLKKSPNDYQVVYWDVESHAYNCTRESVWNLWVHSGYPRQYCYALVTF